MSNEENNIRQELREEFLNLAEKYDGDMCPHEFFDEIATMCISLLQHCEENNYDIIKSFIDCLQRWNEYLKSRETE